MDTRIVRGQKGQNLLNQFTVSSPFLSFCLSIMQIDRCEGTHALAGVRESSPTPHPPRKGLSSIHLANVALLQLKERERVSEWWGAPLFFLEKFEHGLLLLSNNYHWFLATWQKIFMSTLSTRYLNYHALFHITAFFLMSWTLLDNLYPPKKQYIAETFFLIFLSRARQELAAIKGKSCKVFCW